jgi:hypothetical protein
LGGIARSYRVAGSVSQGCHPGRRSQQLTREQQFRLQRQRIHQLQQARKAERAANMQQEAQLRAEYVHRLKQRRDDRPLRKWGDTQFPITARLLSANSRAVKLAEADGFTFELSAEALSVEDRRYVAQVMRDYR